MQALTLAPQPQTHHSLPGQAAAGPDVSEVVKAAETARPTMAPAGVEETARQATEARLAEPVRAEPRSVVAAKNEEAGSAKGASEEAEVPDPMIPPVPMRYLSELIKPREPKSPSAPDMSPEQAAVAQVAATEKAAEAGNSLDILR